MRKVLLVVLAFALVPAAIAVAESTGLKVTGGGQVIASGQNGGGPGDTIAFNAQQTGPATTEDAPAKGQLQVIDRAAGVGQSQVRFHGDVTCIREFTDENGPGPADDEEYVRFGGLLQERGKNITRAFVVDTQDHGEGMMASEDDVVLFRTHSDTADPCDEADSTTSLREPTLARGNVQIHD